MLCFSPAYSTSSDQSDRGSAYLDKVHLSGMDNMEPLFDLGIEECSQSDALNYSDIPSYSSQQLQNEFLATLINNEVLCQQLDHLDNGYESGFASSDSDAAMISSDSNTTTPSTSNTTSPASDRVEEVQSNNNSYWTKQLEDLTEFISEALGPIASSSCSLNSPNDITTPVNNGLIHAEFLRSSIFSPNPFLCVNDDLLDPPASFLEIDSIKKEPVVDDDFLNNCLDLDYLNLDSTPTDIIDILDPESIKKEPDSIETESSDGELKEVTQISKLYFDHLELLREHELKTEFQEPSDSKKDLTSVFIRPEYSQKTLNSIVGGSDSIHDIDITTPSCSSANVGIYSNKDESNHSFNTLKDSKLVSMHDVCPVLPRQTTHEFLVPEPPVRYASSSFNGYPRKLRPIDKVKNDHCYTKAEIYDEPAAMNYNYFLEGVNEIPVPVKRRPGRPRKSSVPVEKQAKVVQKAAPQKRTKKTPNVPAKKMRTLMGSPADCQKRMLHNLAERERRGALRDSLFAVARQCPDHVLNLTEVALSSTKARRIEEIENNFTVDVLRKVDELVKKLAYDKRLLKSKKSPGYSKMVMLLGITYYVSSIEKECKAKESMLKRNQSVLRYDFLKSTSVKYGRRVRKY